MGHSEGLSFTAIIHSSIYGLRFKINVSESTQGDTIHKNNPKQLIPGNPVSEESHTRIQIYKLSSTHISDLEEVVFSQSIQ